jgi:hypothetical protein
MINYIPSDREIVDKKMEKLCGRVNWFRADLLVCVWRVIVGVVEVGMTH